MISSLKCQLNAQASQVPWASFFMYRDEARKKVTLAFTEQEWTRLKLLEERYGRELTAWEITTNFDCAKVVKSHACSSSQRT